MEEMVCLAGETRGMEEQGAGPGIRVAGGRDRKGVWTGVQGKAEMATLL